MTPKEVLPFVYWAFITSCLAYFMYCVGPIIFIVTLGGLLVIVYGCFAFIHDSWIFWRKK